MFEIVMGIDDFLIQLVKYCTIGFANLKSQTGSLLALIEPVAGIFFDLTVLGVALPAGAIAGCLLVLVAAVIVSFSDSSKPSLKYDDGAKIVEKC